ALALFGISSATALGAILIDTAKTQKVENAVMEHNLLTSTLDALRLAPSQTDSAASVAMRAEIVSKETRLAELTTLIESASSQSFSSEGLLKDLCTDKGGLTLHRLQIVVWTI